jgi:hypothetical protein
MSAAGPGGRGCVVAVGDGVVDELVGDEPLLLLEHAVNASTAHAIAAVVAIPRVRLRIASPLRAR